MPLADQFKAFIAEELAADPIIITTDARFVEDLGADSLDIVEFVMSCEESFEIEISDEEAEHITTVAKAQTYTESRLKEEKETPKSTSPKDVREPRSFLQYWKYRQAAQEIKLAGPFNHSASDQFRRVCAGDTVWGVTVDSEGQLFLVGHIVVGEVMDDATVVQRFGEKIFEADYHIAAEAGTEELLRWVNLSSVAPDIRFDSKGGKTHLRITDGRVKGTQLQTMRLLTEEWGAWSSNGSMRE